MNWLLYGSIDCTFRNICFTEIIAAIVALQRKLGPPGPMFMCPIISTIQKCPEAMIISRSFVLIFFLHDFSGMEVEKHP